MSKTSTTSEHLELIAFRAGGQEFCVDVQSVREIRSYSAATPLPHAPDYVAGVINLRGSVLPIIDLAARLRLGPTQPNDRSAIIVTDLNGQLAGLLVDEMSSIMTVRQDEVQPAPAVASSRSKSFVEGMLPLEDRMMSLLSVANILPDDLELAA